MKENCSLDYIQAQGEQIIITVPWEDTKISLPLNLSEPKETIIYKIIREMKKEIAELREQIKREPHSFSLLTQESLKEIWDNQKDDIWNNF